MKGVHQRGDTLPPAQRAAYVALGDRWLRSDQISWPSRREMNLALRSLLERRLLERRPISGRRPRNGRYEYRVARA